MNTPFTWKQPTTYKTNSLDPIESIERIIKKQLTKDGGDTIAYRTIQARARNLGIFKDADDVVGTIDEAINDLIVNGIIVPTDAGPRGGVRFKLVVSLEAIG